MKWICTLSLSHTTTFVDKQMVQSDVSVSSCLLRKYRYFYCHKALLSSFLKKKTPRNLTGEQTWWCLDLCSRKERGGLGRERAPSCSSGRSQLFFHPSVFFSGIFGTVTNPKPTTYEMKIGAISFQVAIGDITKESTDVIVNSTTKMFNLKLGTLLKQYP